RPGAHNRILRHKLAGSWEDRTEPGSPVRTLIYSFPVSGNVGGPALLSPPLVSVEQVVPRFMSNPSEIGGPGLCPTDSPAHAAASAARPELLKWFTMILMVVTCLFLGVF